jgi:hypothetical protein
VADANYVSSQSAATQAAAAVTRMANCVMHLFKSSFSPVPTSPLADFTDAECDFDGYAAITIATWHAAVLAGAAWAIYAPTQTFLWTHVSADVSNSVGGFYLVLAGGALDDFTIFDPAETMAGPGQAVIRTPSKLFPWGLTG